MDLESYASLVGRIADLLKEYDRERPVHKTSPASVWKGESLFLTEEGVPSRTRREPDLDIKSGTWGIECKIVRPFDNGTPAENWSEFVTSVPNESLIGDGLKPICSTEGAPGLRVRA